MPNGQNTAHRFQLAQVATNGDDTIDVSVTPNPATTAAGIVDSLGEPFTVERKSLMARMDAKASEKVEVGKGTLALIALVPSFLLLIFNYGGSVLGWAREDQTTKVSLQQVQSEIKEMREDMRDIKKSMVDREKTEAYKLGMAAAAPDPEETPDKGKGAKKQ